MFVVTVETPRRRQAMHTHLCSYRGNLKNVCVCVCMCVLVHCNFVVVPAVRMKTRYNTYAFMYNILWY
jgi:hypothetical protein